MGSSATRARCWKRDRAGERVLLCPRAGFAYLRQSGVGSGICGASIRTVDSRVTDHVADRQYDGSLCVDESYIAQRPAAEDSVESVGVATVKRRTNGDQVDSLGRQRYRRCPIQDPRSRRLEAQSTVVSFHRGTVWSTGYRFVRNASKQTSTPLLQQVSRWSSGSTRRPITTVDGSIVVCKPTVAIAAGCNAKTLHEPHGRCVGDSILASGLLVASNATNGKDPDTLTDNGEYVHGRSNRKHTRIRQTTLGRAYSGGRAAVLNK